MKKRIIAFMFVALTVLLAGCVKDDEITFSGVEETVIFVGSEFNNLAGVGVTSKQLGIITDITVTGNVDTENVGEYTLTYSVMDANKVKVTKDRLIKVVYEANVLALVNALAHYNSADNYQLNVDFKVENEQIYNPQNYSILMKFDGDKAYFQMNEIEEYYENRQSRIYTYSRDGVTWSVSDERVSSISNSYQFISRFKYNDFTFEKGEEGKDDLYKLIPGHEAPVNDFLYQQLENAEFENFAIKLNNQKLEKISFLIKLPGLISYDMTMTFSDFGNINLVLPII